MPSINDIFFRFTRKTFKQTGFHFVAKAQIIYDNVRYYIKNTIVSTSILRKQTISVRGI